MKKEVSSLLSKALSDKGQEVSRTDINARLLKAPQRQRMNLEDAITGFETYHTRKRKRQNCTKNRNSII